MAVDFGDHASGFRHNEVIRFINNEVLMNGGGPDFYVAFSSRPWNEVEDALRVIIADPQVPCTLKRACAWSALALSVRVAARQQEQQAQQAHWVQWLQEKVEEHEAVSWALSAELWRLREEREEAAVQLRGTWAAWQQALDERDMLHGQLLQLERPVHVAPLAHEVVPQPRPEELGATAWTMDPGELGNMVATGAQGMPQSEGQMAAPAAGDYVPGSQSLWAQVMQHPVPVLVPQPFPFHMPFPAGCQCSTSLPSSAVMEGAAAAAATIASVIPQNSTPGTYPLGLWAQEEMALPYDWNYCGLEEYSENLQGDYSLEDSGSHRLEEDPVGPQGMPSLGADYPPWGQMPSLGAHYYSRSCSQEEDPGRPRETAPLGDSRSHSQNECPVLPQEKYPLGKSESHNQEEGPENSQGTSPLGRSTSRDVRKKPKKQQPQGKKAKQPKRKKASGSQHQGTPASYVSPKNCECPRCKAMNFPLRKPCYKCKKVYKAVESGGPDPGQTH
ncbi:putative testis-expressed protein 13C [Kogia breviceps]|uniref:putative testis-expressed protein 13C n=1 Tax=Kogia breviceps TaxID=27615 RepID=UPI0034D1DF9D